MGALSRRTQPLLADVLPMKFSTEPLLPEQFRRLPSGVRLRLAAPRRRAAAAGAAQDFSCIVSPLRIAVHDREEPRDQPHRTVVLQPPGEPGEPTDTDERSSDACDYLKHAYQPYGRYKQRSNRKILAFEIAAVAAEQLA
ncbi:hypothetical protein ACFYV7_17685 [Nocardia suismassiliense]|uniref:Uncharacterized protein n=1 Tax=Nocardia suismassiliense TaxID=2077092 RepID=A0ABW6QUN6_9NOCA